jgi:hypothetical protein
MSAMDEVIDGKYMAARYSSQIEVNMQRGTVTTCNCVNNATAASVHQCLTT